jgi:hypothetical protein
MSNKTWGCSRKKELPPRTRSFTTGVRVRNGIINSLTLTQLYCYTLTRTNLFEARMPRKAVDKRGFIRIPFKTEVRIDAGSKAIRTNGEFDISMNGIRVPHDGPVPVSTPCQVTIVLQASPPEVAIHAGGRVIRSEKGSLAVELTELDPESYNHLRKLILNNAQDPERAEREIESHRGISNN